VLGALTGCNAVGTAAGGPSPAGGTGAFTAAPVVTSAAAPPLPFPRGPALPLPPVPKPRPGPPETVISAPGGPGSTPQVALTIDDGYSPETVAGYVDFAERTGIPITFSPNGAYQHAWNPHAVRLRPLVEAGQIQIGNHTYSHEDMLGRGNAAIRADIERNEEWIERTFGITARPWFRPPFGKHSVRTDELAGELGYTRILMWEGSFGDSRLLTPRVWMEQARQWLTGGRIVLGHANHPTVTHVFDQLLALIELRRLEPVTLDTMFGTSREAG
jgi:peptidoglycan/xylan/chitin deacetylase (PgdA/CDA1 family)